VRVSVAAVALFLCAAAVAGEAPPSGTAAPNASPDPREILRAMGEAADRLQDYTMLLVKQEFFLDDGGLEAEERLRFKWARPYRVYFRNVVGPNPGREVIYVRGRNGDRIRMHKGSFPDINLNIDPHGAWATDGTHHPIDESSLPDLVRLILSNVADADEAREGSVRWVGAREVDGRACDEIELLGPRSGTVHVLEKGETLWDVARTHGKSMYALLQANRSRGWIGPGDPRRGDAVFVPRYYAGRLDVCVDRELLLPLRMLVWDFDGNLYERYEHRELKVDVGLGDADFDPKNPAYKF
jgi:outer membrane lipoprotein-sorting protein